MTETHTQGSTTGAINDSSENVDFIRANTVPGNKSYADVAMSRKTKNGIIQKVIVFGDSIIRGIRVREFNQQVKNGYAKFKSFPGCNSKEMLHYIEPTLETGFYDSAILHVGVNDLLNNKSPSSTDDLVSNLVKIVNKCKSFGVMDLFVSGIAFNKRLPYAVIKKVNEKIVDMCKKNGIVFIDNGNISNMDLYQDGLHTLERGKCLLANNFIFVLNNFLNIHTHYPFLEKNTHHPPVKEGNIGLVSSEFEAIRENRLKYVNNPLIGYLNINSLRNKIVGLKGIILELILDYLVLSETKMDQSFPAAQFYIKGYEVRVRRDRDKHGSGLIEFIKNGFISKSLKEYETKQSESICSEFAIANRKWICLNIYRPPNQNNINTFFD